MSIAKKVLMLLQHGTNAFDGGDALSLKNRFLFALLQKPMPPSEVAECLRQDKTNIAHLAAGLEQEGLVAREVLRADKRRIRYALTEQGKQRIEGILDEADARFCALVDTPQAQQEACDALDEVIRLLSFL